MSTPIPTKIFTWDPTSHSLIKKRFSWPPYGWTLLSAPEKGIETYYDTSDSTLTTSGLLLRTRPEKATGEMHQEAFFMTPDGRNYLSGEEASGKALVQERIPGFEKVFELEQLCQMVTTRTVMAAECMVLGRRRTFGIVLDVANWGHRVGMVLYLGAVEGEEGEVDDWGVVEGFMRKFPAFFEEKGAKSTLVSWQERMGVA